MARQMEGVASALYRGILKGPDFDPQGADFTRWIDSFNGEVCRNWVVPRVTPGCSAGHAVFEFTVNRDGSLRKLDLLDCSGSPDLFDAARRVLEDSRFRPLPAGYGPDAATMRATFRYQRLA